ncbi:TonB-dependent receptor [Paraglaciecola sp.]|uniref:TonB-dependent receptor n=1 Tax=Paraglaciecola sp. TaxID=1920173 RepID=UPI0030F401A5
MKKQKDKVLDEVVVTGTRIVNNESTALLDKKMSIGVNAIMSAKMIMERPGGNITDILSTLPGVTAYSDMGQGQAATGESEFLSVRGIDSSYNAYLMNGMRMPQADSSTRAISMKMIAPYGLSSARISKTPMAEDSGDAIGAIVEINTPTGFEKGDDYRRFTGGLNYSELANDRDFDATGHVAQFEFANVFGDQNYGLYATVYHENRYAVAETLESTYTSAHKSEDETDDWRNLKYGLVAKDLRFDFYETAIERFGGNISFDHKLENATFYVRANYGHYKAEGSESQRKIYIDSSTFDENTGFYRGKTAGSNGYFQLRDQEATLANVQAGGDWLIQDDLNLAYNLSYGNSEVKTPNYIEGSLYSQKYEGALSFDLSDPANPLINYSSNELRTQLTDKDAPRFRKTQGGDAGAKNTMYGVKLDLTYTPQGFFDEIKMGLDYSVSDRDQYDRPLVHDNGNYTIPTPDGDNGGSSNPQGPYASQIAGQDISFGDGGFDNFRVYDRSYFEDYMLPVAYTDVFTKTGIPNPGAYTEDDRNRKTVSGTETISALYLQSKHDTMNWNIVTGIRFENTDFKESHWLIDADNHRFVVDDTSYNQFSPNLNVSYRPTEELVYRFAARRSFSRPAFSLIAGPESYSYDDNTDLIKKVSRSNPDLKPTTAYNYDASIEWYPMESTVMEVAIYRKDFSHFIYTASTTGAEPPAEYSDNLQDGVTYEMPQNGKGATLQGVEGHTRYQFPMHGGFFDGFGLDTTATLQHSTAESSQSDRTSDTALPRSPKLMYNLQLFYQGDEVSAGLTWQYIGRQLLSLTNDKLDKYLQAHTQLDFNVTYKLEDWSITAQVQNLLDNEAFYKTLGKDKRYIGTQDGGGNGSFVETGRTLKVFASYQF